MLLIIAAFSVVFLLQAAAKVQKLCEGLRKLDFKTPVIYNPQALRSTLTLLGHHYSWPSGCKSHRPLFFEVYYLTM